MRRPYFSLLLRPAARFRLRSPFDDTGGDGEAALEVSVIDDAMGVVVEVPADALQRAVALEPGV